MVICKINKNAKGYSYLARTLPYYPYGVVYEGTLHGFTFVRDMVTFLEECTDEYRRGYFVSLYEPPMIIDRSHMQAVLSDLDTDECKSYLKTLMYK